MHALVAEAEHWTDKSEIVGSISLFKVNFLLKFFLLWFEKVFDVNQLQQLCAKCKHRCECTVYSFQTDYYEMI